MDGMSDTITLDFSDKPQEIILNLDEPVGNVPPMPRQLRSAVGDSNGRITLEQHLDRLDYVFRNIPETVWPSTGKLCNQFHGQTAIIVGGAPGLLDTYDELRWQIHTLGDQCKVFAPNRSHDFLLAGERAGKKKWKRYPIKPDFGVLVDPSDFVAEYQTPQPDVTYLLGACLHWKTFARFLKADARAYIWTPTYCEHGEDIDMIAAKKYPREIHFVSGYSTVGLRTVNLCAALGFSTVDLYGFDSCYAPGYDPSAPWQTDGRRLYAYDKPRTIHKVADATVVSKTDGSKLRFLSNAHMSKQAIEFNDMVDKLPELQCDGKMHKMQVRVHGDGVIPWLAWKCGGPDRVVCHATPEKMAAKYGNAKHYDYANSKVIA